MSVSKSFVARKVARGASPDRFRGVPEEDVIRLEHALGVRFPAVYRDYLLLMGYEPCGCGKSVDIRFGCLNAINKEIRAAFPNAQQSGPSGKLTAIYANQGVDYLCFSAHEADNNEDPPLHRFHALKGAYLEGCPSITDYLERLFTGDIILPD